MLSSGIHTSGAMTVVKFECIGKLVWTQDDGAEEAEIWVTHQ